MNPHGPSDTRGYETAAMSSIRKRAPKSTSATVRRVMQANVGVETKPERLLRCALHRAGARFRKAAKPEPDLRITADVVFRRQKVCIFVDGCFWHGCPEHFRPPKTNASWWREKIADNARRDRDQSRLLMERGWQVVRLWEHQISESSLPAIIARIMTAIRKGMD